MRLSRSCGLVFGSWCALSVALACSDVPGTSAPADGGTSGSSGRGGSAGSAGMKSNAGGSAGNTGSSGNAPTSGGSGGTPGNAGSATAGTGGSAPSAGSGGSGISGNGGGSGTNTTGGSGATGGSNAGPVDCAGIVDAGHELCSSGSDFCAAVFDDGAGCVAVCAAAGLDCAEVWENAEDSCGPDTERAELSCDSDHESDYCVCRGGPAGGAGSGAGGSSGMGGSTSNGGSSGSGGTTTAGSGGTGGASGGSGKGGSGGTAGAGGSGNAPAIGPGPCGCENPAGEFGTVNSTIIVGSGQVYDGQCQIYRANPETLGPGDQSEDQLPVFRVEDGGELRNVVLGASAADGIHLYGDVILENIHWLDIGEDAMTVKESGTVRLNCGSATNGDDKVFQVNAASEIFISNFTASNAGKFMRQNGGTDFEVNVTIDHSDISDMGEVIFRTDSGSSHVTFTNSRHSNLGEGLFMFGDEVVNGNSSQSTVSNIEEY